MATIAIGSAQLSGYDYGEPDVAIWARAVDLAWDRGIRHFDAADVYGFGRAERLLASILGERNRDAVISTKFGLRRAGSGIIRDSSLGWLNQTLHSSLRNLRRERIDYYYLHAYDGVTPLAEIAERLQRYQEQGKIGRIGASNLAPLEIKRLVESGLGAYQFPYNLLCRKPETGLIQMCRQFLVHTVAHSALARGALAGCRTAVQFGPGDSRIRSRYFALEAASARGAILNALAEIGAATGFTAAQLALKWVASRPGVGTVVVGVRDEVQMRQHLQALGSDVASYLGVLDEISAGWADIMDGTWSKKCAPPGSSKPSENHRLETAGSGMDESLAKKPVEDSRDEVLQNSN